jgi:uncharacterized phage protein (TIGR01671 family)
MFRDFKFKVWDLIEKAMYKYDGHLVYNKNKAFKPDEEVNKFNAPYFFIFPHKGFGVLGFPSIIMEFTGVEDKNGTEIYEYDIVKRVYQEFDFDTNEYINKTEISFVEHMGKGFWVNGESFGWEGEKLWDWSKIEVIGNLYETPELYYSINNIL